ncbi:hypothetical protein ACFQ5M_01135 [Agrilactobacillus yilanensis]|uniref:Fructose permease n=1 Tax=Agrilactobacillus yilanensis TaxID=2485997 RepID=A0ABW4J2T8_9LACO|nr:hypothetical protein [Agrilactobacillus yilanensis]
MQKSFTYRLVMLIIALIIAGLTQALTITTELGATIWSASSLNILGAIFQTADLSKINGYNGTTMLIMSLLLGLLNMKLSPESDWGRFFRNLLFVVPFSYFIQFFVPFWQFIFEKIHPFIPNDTAWFGLMIFLDIVGLAGVALEISLYQRANLILHPIDDLTFILRFYYLKGNSTKSQLISFLIPATITLISVLLNHGQLISVGFGTVWAIFTQGPLIAFFDKHVCPSFKHQALVREALN